MQSRQRQLNNTGIYLRLSKDDERAGESLSIDNQRLILQKYVAERGWNLVDEYVDDGFSGTDFERPQVKRLLDDAKTGRINTIVVKDLIGGKSESGQIHFGLLSIRLSCRR